MRRRACTQGGSSIKDQIRAVEIELARDLLLKERIDRLKKHFLPVEEIIDLSRTADQLKELSRLKMQNQEMAYKIGEQDAFRERLDAAVAWLKKTQK